MKPLELNGHLSGYKINVSKTQILAFNYVPSQEICESYNVHWNLKSIKYVVVMITKNISELYSANYKNLTQELLKDITRRSTLPLDLNSRNDIEKMNILPTFLYMFQSLPIEVPQSQFIYWDRMIFTSSSHHY